MLGVRQLEDLNLSLYRMLKSFLCELTAQIAAEQDMVWRCDGNTRRREATEVQSFQSRSRVGAALLACSLPEAEDQLT